MQYKAFMIKYAEIGTKGKNRYIFEDILCKNINRKLKNYGDFYIRKEQGRIFVECKSDYDYEDVVGALGKGIWNSWHMSCCCGGEYRI